MEAWRKPLEKVSAERRVTNVSALMRLTVLSSVLVGKSQVPSTYVQRLSWDEGQRTSCRLPFPGAQSLPWSRFNGIHAGDFTGASGGGGRAG